MIINKAIYTEEEQREIDAINAQFAQNGRNGADITKKIKKADEAGEPLEVLVKQREDYIAELNALIEQKEQIKAQAEQRYIESFNGDIDAILTDIREIVSAFEKEDFTAYIDRSTRLHSQTLENEPGEDATPEEKEAYRKLKARLKKNYINCCIYMTFQLRTQLNAISHYKELTEEINRTILDIIEAKVGTFYKPPKQAKKIEINLEETAPYYGPDFRTIKQNTATNMLARAITGMSPKDSLKKKAIIEADSITGISTIRVEGEKAVIKIPSEALPAFRTSARKLLDAITIKLTETGAKSRTVTLPLKEYMQMRGLKDRKETKNQANKDLDILEHISMGWEEKRGENILFRDSSPISGGTKILRNGDIIFKFSEEFFSRLLGFPVMPYPEQLGKLNDKRNPNSYYFLRKIAEHKNMNIGRGNEDIISVQTLLDASPVMPTYEEVMRTGKQLSQRIIEPFIRDMDALKPTIKWEFIGKRGTAPTDKQLELKYNDFKSLQVKITWSSYPYEQQQAKLERKAKAIKKADKKKAQEKKASEAER